MAYNLESCIQILEQDQHYLSLNCRDRIESLLTNLRDVVGHYPPIFTRGMQNLEIQMRDVAHMIEDTIESHIIDQVHSGECQLDLTSLMEQIHSIREEMSTIQGNDPPHAPAQDPEPSSTVIGYSDWMKTLVNWLDWMKTLVSRWIAPHAAAHDPEPSSTVIALDEDVGQLLGLDEDVGKLLDLLTPSGIQELQVIPIVGMGGMGKTALANAVYNHSSVKSNLFDKRACIKISQHFDARSTMLSLLYSFGKPVNETEKVDNVVLADYVYQTLLHRRYLILIDDVWETKVWDELNMLFPSGSDCCGSRIILTTRERRVANDVCGGGYAHEMGMLDDDNSWKLLLVNVFGQETCPHDELVEPGRRIATNCGGLPLAIIVTAGLLSTSEMTPEFWNSVARSFGSASAQLDVHEQCLEILSKSYNHLPYDLKPCFLYLGAFPADYEIRASRIIELWIAEGIIKSKTLSLADMAEVQLNDLIDRNLLSVIQHDSNGKVRTFKIHHFLKELCRRIAVEEKFLWFRMMDDQNILGDEEIMRRMSVHPSSQPPVEMNPMPLVRSFLCFHRASEHLSPLFFGSPLLRMLDVFQLEFGQFPTQILQLVNLRYLALSCHSALPPSISRFQNLQTLKIQLPSVMQDDQPSQLWEMTQLRRIKSKGTCIRCSEYGQRNVILENLVTLSDIDAVGMTNLYQRTPNITKLGIHHDDTPINSVIDLAEYLQKLENLKCSSVMPSKFLLFLRLPDSLKKLTVSSCEIPRSFITVVGYLPHLEQLKLLNSDFLCEEGEAESEATEPQWEPPEGGFLKLISLVMEDLNLVNWISDDTSFPELQRLSICRCSSMKNISLDIGVIPTLELIEVDETSALVHDSVKAMDEEQERSGNVSVTFVYHTAF